jgi:zinc protease
MRTVRFRPGVAVPLIALVMSGLLQARGPQVQAPPKPTLTTPAQAPPAGSDQLPPAREIIDRHVKAIGGKEAVLARTSAHMTATVSMPSAGVSGTLEVYAAKPDKILTRTTLPGIGEIQEGYDGKVAWSISPLTGASVLDGKQYEQRKFDSDFYSELRSNERYKSIMTVEKTTFDGRPCYKVRFVKPSGDEEFEFYEVESGLKAGGTSVSETPIGAVSSTMTVTEYKKFGNLLVPTTVRVEIMGGMQQIVQTVQAIEFNSVNPSVFELPASIKAILK